MARQGCFGAVLGGVRFQAERDTEEEIFRQREKLVQRAHGGNNYSGLKDPTGWFCGWSMVGTGQCGKSWGPRGKQRPDGAGRHQL